MKIDELAFPIVVLAERENMIYAFSKPEETKRTTEELLRQGVFSDNTLIDCNGIVFVRLAMWPNLGVEGTFL
jgi:hypothetical protein